VTRVIARGRGSRAPIRIGSRAAPVHTGSDINA